MPTGQLVAVGSGRYTSKKVPDWKCIMQGDFKLAEWLIQPSRNVIESRNGSVQVEPKAMDLLVFLARHPGQVLSKERLIQTIWPDAFVTDEVLTNSIWKLRQAFEDDPKNPRVIKTVPRRGYQLIVEVESEEPTESAESRYRIERKLGRGAMGEVYLAEDTFLRRRVALKFLLAEMEEDGHWHRRMFREAQAAAALDHPFICKVYDVGQIDGRSFIAMEYVEGETLKQRLAQGPLPLRQAVQVAREIAEALEIAHQEGIVHRDIKPSNIALTRQGHVKVMDFGLAKKIAPEPQQDPDWTATLTEEVSTMGTLPYMSPEQIRGQPLDASSDLFSVAVVLYEALTGSHPFRKNLTADTAASILTQEPQPLSRFGEFPEALQQILDRLLAKDPADRYSSAVDLQQDLRSISHPSRLPFAHRKAGQLGNRPLKALALVAVVLVIAGLGWWLSTGTGRSGDPPHLASIAVLPLDDLIKEEGLEYLVDGSTENLIMELSKWTELRVISRKTVERYRDTTKMIPIIAREIETAGGYPVDALAYGSIAKPGADSVRLNLTLMQVEPEAVLWTQRYDTQLAELPALYQEAAGAIAEKIGLRTPRQIPQGIAAMRKINPEAYDAVLRGSYLLSNTYSKESFIRSMGLFRKALDLEPTFASAYVGLAEAYSSLDFWFPPEEVYPKAEEAARRAQELDDSQVLAHSALGGVEFWYHWRWESAEEEYMRALSLNPSASGIHLSYSRYLTAMSRFEEAISECEEAIRLDPLTDRNRLQLGWTYVHARRYDEAIVQFQKILDLNPDDGLTLTHLSWPYAFSGRYAEAAAILDALPPDSYGGSAAYIYALAGQRDKAMEIVNELLRLKTGEYFDPTHLAVAYVGLGDNEAALDLLEEAYEHRNPYLVLLNVDPSFDPLRDNPRFQELLRGIGFEP